MQIRKVALMLLFLCSPVWAENYAAVYRVDGMTWERQDAVAIANTGTLAPSVDALGDGKAWVVTGHGSIRRYDGLSWETWPEYTVSPGGWTRVAAIDWDNIYVSGSTNHWQAICHFDGNSWFTLTQADLPIPINLEGKTNLHEIIALDPSHIWVSAEMRYDTEYTGGVLHYNGKDWSLAFETATSTTAYGFRAITAADANNVWTVRQASGSDILYHFNGTTWQEDTSILDALDANYLQEGVYIKDIEALSASSVWACGRVGDDPRLPPCNIWHYDGNNWVTALETWECDHFRAIEPISDDDVYVIGREIYTDVHRLYHYDGVEWTWQYFPEDFQIIATMDAGGPGDLWIAGDPPTIPEPATLCLVLAGGILLLRRRTR